MDGYIHFDFIGKLFCALYFKTKISTLPEFLEKRFDSDLNLYGIYGDHRCAFIHIGISLYAGAIVFQNFLGPRFRIYIIMISMLTAIYTVIGGLKAVVITENIQTVILLAGSIILTFLSDFLLYKILELHLLKI